MLPTCCSWTLQHLRVSAALLHMLKLLMGCAKVWLYDALLVTWMLLPWPVNHNGPVAHCGAVEGGPLYEATLTVDRHCRCHWYMLSLSVCFTGASGWSRPCTGSSKQSVLMLLVRALVPFAASTTSIPAQDNGRCALYSLCPAWRPSLLYR